MGIRKHGYWRGGACYEPNNCDPDVDHANGKQPDHQRAGTGYVWGDVYRFHSGSRVPVQFGGGRNGHASYEFRIR
jgi:hypothetical protein